MFAPGSCCAGALPCPERAGRRVLFLTADQPVYLVVDRFSSGSLYRETEIERTDLDTIINDFMTGQFNDPVRVVAFNTLEHWADDISKDVAREIQARCDIAGEPMPEHVEDFVATYAGRMRQLALPLV